MLLDLVSSLGAGKSLTVALVLGMAGWYIIRGKSALSTVAGVIGTAGTIAAAVLGVLVISIGLGWFDPQPGVFLSHASTAIKAVGDAVGGWVVDWVRGVFP